MSPRGEAVNSPIRAEVVNAFVTSLREIFLTATGLQAELAPLGVVSDSPAPPNMVVRIQISGELAGSAICSFSPGVARASAGYMLASESPAFDSPETRDALGELANILVGNATGALLEQGYSVELSPPTTELASAPQKLARQSVNVSLNTDSGQVCLVLCLTQD